MSQSVTKIPKSKKKNFSSFSVGEAYKQLGIITLLPWEFECQPLPITDFFKKRLERLQKRFDLRSYEESKKLLIDAFCEEAMEDFDQLKIWKGGRLESDVLIGNADYIDRSEKRLFRGSICLYCRSKKRRL